MTPEQERAIRLLIDGLEFFDQYEPVPSDDTPVYAVVDDNSLHEFAGDDDRLRVGHLRDIASIFLTEE